jgi:hypothetical protein
VLEDVCLTDPCRKYDYLQALKSSGLAVKATMLTYRHGNNIGNTVSGKFMDKMPILYAKASKQLKSSRNKFLRFTQEQCDNH